MVELHKKYQIGERRFGVNWVGAYTLYLKETLRFLSVFGQTIIGPVVTAILFLLKTTNFFFYNFLLMHSYEFIYFDIYIGLYILNSTYS